MMDENVKNSEVDLPQLHFDNVKNFVLNLLDTNTWDIDVVCDTFNNCNEIIKTAIEHGLRYYILTNFKKLNAENFKYLLDLSINAAQRKLCSPTTPIFLINDILNNLKIDECSDIFAYLEDSSQVWKSELFYSSVRNYLLRMCNDLLKRLSKSQNTVFSGRIHLFLAKLFPLNEKSGLNLMSHFSENTTRYTTSAELFEQTLSKEKANDSTMETDEEGAMTDRLLRADSHHPPSIPIDYNLYKKFWSLQDFFTKPNALYEKTLWKQFTNNTSEVLEALKSYKLDDESSSSKKSDAKKNSMNVYFAKYLTSPKLLDLQLNDSNFRRQILVQFLIIFQYVHAEVKFKSTTQSLSEEQSTWVKGATAKVYQLLKETPPDGNTFSENVKHILDREEIWNKWKNEGCPNFIREKRPAAAPVPQRPKRPKPLTSDFDQGASKQFVFSNPEMAKLCNMNHDNLNACKDPNRQFLPTLRDFFEEPIDQMDPANQVEKQYYLINRTEWSWKALRLLAKRSAFYFMQNQNVRTIPEYLEAICMKLAKEFQVNQSEQAGTSESESVQPNNDDESVQLNDETGHSHNQGHHRATQHSNNGNSNGNMNTASATLHSIETTEQLIEPKVAESQTMTSEERLLKLKQEFQIDDFQDDSQSSTQSPIATPRRVDRSVFEDANAMEISTTKSITAVESNSQMSNAEDCINETFMDVIASRIKSADDWKKLAQELLMDEDTIAFIESDVSEVQTQCKKILQLWKEREEKKSFLSIVIKALKALNDYSELVSELERI